MLKNNKSQNGQPKPQPAKKELKKQTKQSKLQRLVKANLNFQFLANGKIRCILTKHQFLPTLQNFQKYLTSKSYRNGLESRLNISEYEQFLIPHKVNEKFLFCRLTGCKLPKRKTAIEKHVKSKRFQLRMKEYLEDNEEDQAEQIEEIVDEEEGEEQK